MVREPRQAILRRTCGGTAIRLDNRDPVLVAEVHEHGRAVRSPWQPFSLQPLPGSLPQDPYALTVYGELAVVARVASALAEQAVDALLRGLAQDEDLHDEECAQIAVLASAAEAAASRAAEEITHRALEVVGAETASVRHGFDRFWRDARTHTLREPAAHRLREIGDYFLNGAYPSFVLPACAVPATSSQAKARALTRGASCPHGRRGHSARIA